MRIPGFLLAILLFDSEVVYRRTPPDSHGGTGLRFSFDQMQPALGKTPPPFSLRKDAPSPLELSFSLDSC